MPVTTFMKFKTTHPNQVVEDLLKELNNNTTDSWCAEKVLLKKRFFKPDIYITYLYKHIKYSEYQVFSCVENDSELKAFIYGALYSLGVNIKPEPPENRTIKTRTKPTPAPPKKRAKCSICIQNIYQ